MATTATRLRSLTLYSAPFSDCSARVRIALRLKNISAVPVTIEQVDTRAFEHRTSPYLALNPNATVPTLIVECDPDTGSEHSHVTMITQSLAMLDFLENTFPNPALLPPPADDQARARVMELVSLVAADIQPPQSTRIREMITKEFKGDGNLWARGVFDRGLTVYENLLARGPNSRYSVGDQVTLADICLVPVVQLGLRFGIETEKWPRIMRVVEECWKMDAFKYGGLGENGNFGP